MNNTEDLKHPGLMKGKTKAEGSFYIITIVSVCKSKGFVNLNVHFKLCTQACHDKKKGMFDIYCDYYCNKQ